VGVKQFVGSAVVCEVGFNNTFCYFGYDSKVRDWTVV